MIEYAEQLIKKDKNGSVFYTVLVKSMPHYGFVVVSTHSKTVILDYEGSFLKISRFREDVACIVSAKAKAKRLINRKINLGFLPIAIGNSIDKVFVKSDLKNAIFKKGTIVGFEQGDVLKWICKTSAGKNLVCGAQNGISITDAILYLGRTLAIFKTLDRNHETYTALGFIDQS